VKRWTNAFAQGNPMSVIVAFGNAARNARNAGTEQSKSPSCNARKIAIVRGYVTERVDDIERTGFRFGQ
jgi:uncharacterized protein (DUF3084 family)